MEGNKKEIIISQLQDEFSPYVIYVFGSAVNGNTRRDSDIDVAFVSEKTESIDAYDIYLAAQGLAEKLNQDVDLVDLNRASTVFQAQVVSTGRVIFCNDNYKRDVFEMKTLKMYAKLNEERAVIIDRIGESGSIYEK